MRDIKVISVRDYNIWMMVQSCGSRMRAFVAGLFFAQVHTEEEYTVKAACVPRGEQAGKPSLPDCITA